MQLLDPNIAFISCKVFYFAIIQGTSWGEEGKEEKPTLIIHLYQRGSIL
jgi:hypothetical protein